MKRAAIGLGAILVIIAGSPPLAAGTTYQVGPGQVLATPSQVPWESLQPGDVVLIHWRAAPYTDKWVICREGTAAAPITVRGVPGSAGELPVIDGDGATTRLALARTTSMATRATTCSTSRPRVQRSRSSTPAAGSRCRTTGSSQAESTRSAR